MGQHRADHGFTLIELMIVVTIIAIIASIAVPSLLSARSNANEKAVIATLRSLITAQELARSNVMIDTDRDGQGEAAGMGELAGTELMRGAATFLKPPYLSVAMGQLDVDGHALSHGFLFALYAADAAGTGVVAAPANWASVDANMSETYWTCLAWPRDRQAQGYATYFANQNGDILASKRATYSGKTSIPPAGAALLGVPATQINSTSIAVGTNGADGNLWVPVH
jgi:prepilin-type N-terminal cleavage/methylation domain-containing protein